MRLSADYPAGGPQARLGRLGPEPRLPNRIYEYAPQVGRHLLLAGNMEDTIFKTIWNTLNQLGF